MMNKSMGQMLNSLVSISEFNKGKASSIISDLGPEDVKIIVKNNVPMAAIIPVERFSKLLEAEENLKEKENGK